jgi:hypothetical protein
LDLFQRELTYVNSNNNHRITISIGDFIQVRQDERVPSGIARVDIIFIHELLSGYRRVFAMITRVSDYGQRDLVTGAPILNLQHRQEIVGLPAVEGRKLYVVSLSRKLCGIKLEELVHGTARIGKDSPSGEVESLLHCPWDVTFL